MVYLWACQWRIYTAMLLFHRFPTTGGAKQNQQVAEAREGRWRTRAEGQNTVKEQQNQQRANKGTGCGSWNVASESTSECISVNITLKAWMLLHLGKTISWIYRFCVIFVAFLFEKEPSFLATDGHQEMPFFFATAKCHLFFSTPIFSLIFWAIFPTTHIITSKGNFPSHGRRPTNIYQIHKCVNYNCTKCTIKYSFPSKLQSEHRPQIRCFWCVLQNAIERGLHWGFMEQTLGNVKQDNHAEAEQQLWHWPFPIIAAKKCESFH